MKANEFKSGAENVETYLPLEIVLHDLVTNDDEMIDTLKQAVIDALLAQCVCHLQISKHSSDRVVIKVFVAR